MPAPPRSHPRPTSPRARRPLDLSSIWCGCGSHLPSISPDQVELEKDELVDEIQRLRRPSRLNLCAGKNYLFVDFDSIDDALTVRERIEGRAFGGKTIVVGFRNPPNQFQR